MRKRGTPKGCSAFFHGLSSIAPGIAARIPSAVFGLGDYFILGVPHSRRKAGDVRHGEFREK